MLKITLRYAGYAFAALSGVGFALASN